MKNIFFVNFILFLTTVLTLFVSLQPNLMLYVFLPQRS
nr:MAG TPA: hypothetical protein [Caudoviricetes sp.]